MDVLFLEEPKVETLLRTSSCFYCAQQKEKELVYLMYIMSSILSYMDKQHSYSIDWFMTQADWLATLKLCDRSVAI